MKPFKLFAGVTLFIVLAAALATLPVEAVAQDIKTDDSTYNIYFRPAIRWGTNGRTLYIADFFIPLYQGDKSILFANPKFTPNDHDGWELNVGLGYRHLLLDDNLLLGLNAFYDKRRSDRGNYFDQWGIGTEIMADIPIGDMDLGLTGRFNFYSPISNARIEYEGTGSGHLFQNLGIHSFAGEGEFLVEEPLRGFDYELGVRIPYLSDYVETWAYAGGYNYFGKYTEHVDGFMARLEVIPTDFLRLNFEYKNDNINHDEFYGEVAVEVPFSITNLAQGKNPFEGLGRRLSGSRDLRERMVDPVRRDVDIVVVNKSIDTTASGIGGLVEEVVFVSETAAPAVGDGTFENPYASMTEVMTDARIIAGTCTTIHVINDSGGDTAGGGDFTTAGPIASLLLWGSGTNHPVYPNISNMTAGFPEMSTTLTVDDAGAEVMGIYFNNAGGDGLIVQGGPGTLVHHNRFNANGGHGMWLDGFNTISIYNNAFTGTTYEYAILIGAGDTANIYDNTFTGFAGVVGNGGAPNVTINTNTFNVVYSAVNMDYGGNSIEDLNIINNIVNVSSSISDAIGIRLFTDLGGADIGSAGNPVNIDNNTVTCNSNSGAGAIVLDSDGDIFADITNNDMTGGITGDLGAAGISLISGGNIGYDGATFDPVTITDNSMTVTSTAGEAYGIQLNTFLGTGGYNIFADIADNNMTGGITGDLVAAGIALDGINSIGFEGNPVTITDNRMTVSAEFTYGIVLESNNSDIFTDITGNDMTGGITGDLLSFGINLNSILGRIGSETDPVNINNNRMTLTTGGSGGLAAGIYFFAYDDLFSTITGNNISNTVDVTGEAAGIAIRSDTEDIGSAVTPVTVSDNTMTVNGGYAVGISFPTGNNFFADITGNIMTGGIIGANVAYGIYLETSSAGNIGFDGTTINPVTITNNPMIVDSTLGYAYGIYLDTDNDLFADITGNDMTGGITGGGPAYGISLLSTSNYVGTPTNPVWISDNSMTVSSTGGNAYGIDLDSYNDICAIIYSNIINGVSGNTNAYGIRLNATGTGGDIYADIADNDMTGGVAGGNDTYGIYLNTAGLGSDIFTIIIGNDMTGGINGGNDAWGIYLDSEGGYVGSDINWVMIYNNRMGVTATNNAHGIHLDAYDSIYADLTGNIMAGGIFGGNDAYGIRLDSSNSGISAAIRNNEMSGAIFGGNSAYGIHLGAEYGIITDITGNLMTGGITGSNITCGIELNVLNGYIETVISGNDLSGGINGGFGEAYGISLNSTEEIEGAIGINNLGGITGAGLAAGIYLNSSLDDIGSSMNPILISDNSMAVSSTGDSAYGINLDAYNDIYADVLSNIIGNVNGSINAYGIRLITDNNISGNIYNNIVSGGVTGGNEAYGISLVSENGIIGYDWAGENPVTITDNTITVASTAGGDYAYGISLDAYDYIFAEITDNIMMGGIAGATRSYGISLDSGSGGIGSSSNPVRIDGNFMTVIAGAGSSLAYGISLVSDGDDIYATIDDNNMGGGMGIFGRDSAYGIYLNTVDGDIFTDIYNNDMTGAGISGGNNAHGIYLDSDYGIGGTGLDVIDISNNDMIVYAAGGGVASGISLIANDSIFAQINDNDMSGGITGALTYGIRIIAGGYVGSSSSPVTAMNNLMTVTSSTGSGSATGIYISADYSLYAYINNNTSMNITSNSSDAWGAYLTASGGTIGSGTIATYFTNNSGTVDGPFIRYMLQLFAGVPGTGSNVDWGMGGQVNSFTSLSGGVGANWTGNYDAGDGLPAPGGANKPVETNFNASDSLWP